MNRYKVTYEADTFVSETEDKRVTETVEVSARTLNGAAIQVVLMANGRHLTWPDITRVEYLRPVRSTMKVIMSVSGHTRHYSFATDSVEDALDQAMAEAKSEKLYQPGQPLSVIGVHLIRDENGRATPDQLDRWLTPEEMDNKEHLL